MEAPEGPMSKKVFLLRPVLGGVLLRDLLRLSLDRLLDLLDLQNQGFETTYINTL